MRLVPVNCVRDGSYLAKTIYDSNGRVLLSKDYKLTPIVLRKVEQNGIMSLYINDEYSDNEIEDFIKPELRQKAIKQIKDSYEGIARYNSQSEGALSSGNNRQNTDRVRKYINDIASIAGEIVDDITADKNVLINLVDIKSMDNYTYEHSISVTVLSIILGMELKFTRQKLVELAVGALLHDMGKVFVPREILQKKDKLLNKEFEIIKRHTVDGYDYIKSDLNISFMSSGVILQHHEKVDGTGYPEGLKGDRIHEYARVVAIADVYDALTSDRPYRRAMSPNEAMEYLMGAAQRHFDYRMVHAFIKKIVPYPVGTLVRLSTEDIGVVYELSEGYPLRPKIKIVNAPRRGALIDLMKEKNIVIEGIQYEAPGQGQALG